MKPSEINKALHHFTEIRRPVFLWGPPGVGKSDVVAQVAAERKLELRDVRLSLMDPTDIKGFPVPDMAKNQMRWLPANFLPTKGKGILFLDEMNTAPQATQAAAYQLTLTGQIGDYTLPPGWTIIGAGNRAGDRSVTHAQPAALANRFAHLDFDVDLVDWCAWANRNGIHSDVIAFIRFRSNLLHNFDPSTNPRAFASPRTWKFVNDSYSHKTRPSKSMMLPLYSGMVGEGPASEFCAFVDMIRDLPTVDEIKLNPTKAPVPSSPATLYAITTALAQATTTNNFEIFMKYIDRVQTEFQVVYVKDALAKEDKITDTKSFVDWGMKNGDVVL